MECLAATAAADAHGDVASIPLCNWIKREEEAKSATVVDLEKDNITRNNESIIQRTTIAYGIAELLKRSSSGALDEENDIRIDDFIVIISKNPSRSWDDIKGVAMISSGRSVTIEEPSYLHGLLEEEEDCVGQMGRHLEVEFKSTVPRDNSKTPQAAAAVNLDEHQAGMNGERQSNRCHSFARLLYELFTHEPFPDDDDALAVDADAAPTINEPDQKRARKSHDVSSRKKLMLTRAKGDFDRAEIPFQLSCIVRMQKLGIPVSICLMTQNLLECALRGNGNGDQLHNAYESLAAVGEDLHLLLLDPDRFLFDNRNQSTQNGMQLLYRSDKLYGRDKEETLITDALCRVSRGKSEAFFIGGFSGSGKSMLVDSLRDRVKCVGGYVTKHKFDAMSREKPLSGVISALNQLRDEFGVDFSLLLRLLPNASVLFPELISPAMRVEVGEAMNARSVCFMLLRFARVVSSPRHPIMLFLDDMQWADSTALDVIHTILSDTMGSSCMFFVGTYRDNEVQIDHDIFDLMERLEISNVRTTKVSLTGLDQEDLNTMISDAL
eukprot:scaffold2301_cov73-Skeletonema_dohrnii-CCMP3373.AAC.2